MTPSELLLSHSSITPEIASNIVRNRPQNSYQNMRELQTRNTALPDVWDQLETSIEFHPALDLSTQALSSIARKYGNSAPSVKRKTSQPSANNTVQNPLEAIKNRYGK